MGKRMTAERLIEIEHVENEDTRLELYAALQAEREVVEQLENRIKRVMLCDQRQYINYRPSLHDKKFFYVDDVLEALEQP